jgi:hypothetical protein
MFSKRLLPRGYKFTDLSSIDAGEAVRLFKDSEYIVNPRSDHTALEEWDEALQESLAIVGVRDRDKKTCRTRVSKR